MRSIVCKFSTSVQHAHASTLCELGALLAAVEGCHLELSRCLCLPPWEDLLGSVDERASLTQNNSRLAKATAQVCCEKPERTVLPPSCFL